VHAKPAVAQAGTDYLRVDYGPSASPDLSKIPTITAFAPDVGGYLEKIERSAARINSPASSWK